MAEFRIWGRWEHIGPAQFLCIVSAVPLRGDRAEVVTKSADSINSARRIVDELAIELGAILRTRGDVVVDVETD